MSEAPEVRCRIDQVEVRAGQTLTVWLDSRPPLDNGPMNRKQVELRVLSDGTPQVFVDAAEVQLADFGAWYSAERLTERRTKR